MSRSLWRMPAALGATTLIGLVAALTGDGWRDWIAWVALVAPVLVALGAIRART